MIELREEILELCKKFITEGFAGMKKDNTFKKEYRKIMYNKNTPDFLHKYFERYGDKLKSDAILIKVCNETGLSIKQIKFKLRYGQTMSEILSLYNK